MSLDNDLNNEIKIAMYDLAIFLCGLCVLFTTALNVAFTVMPDTMAQMARSLIA